MILRCAASLAAGKGAPNPPSEYAAEGTAYHEISARVLAERQQWGCTTDGLYSCAHYVGTVVEADGFKFTIDEDNAAHAQTYVDAIRRLPGAQYYEVRLDTSEVVGVPGQGGTGDAVTLDFDAATIHVDDLKFGRGEVVFAEKNEQLIQYGAAALEKFALSHDWKFLKVAIHQPRLNHYSEHTYAVEEVRAWVEENRPKFQRAFWLYQQPEQITPADYSPGEKQCRWCPIKGSCKARSDSFLAQFPIAEVEAVQRTQMLTDAELAAARDRVDAIEQWCADIKVVAGRMGNRKWTDEAEVENILVSGLREAAYKPKQIISPADAEKKLKKHSALWDVLVPRITQAEGAKSLVRDDSPKAAVATGHVEFPVQAPV